MKFINLYKNEVDEWAPSEVIPDGYTLITVQDLKTTLVSNLEKHRAEYTIAIDNYKKAYLARLRDLAKDFRKDSKIPEQYIGVTPPENNIKTYECVIRQLELSLVGGVALSVSEFNNYVMDDWSWKRDLAVLNQTYSAVLNKR